MKNDMWPGSEDDLPLPYHHDGPEHELKEINYPDPYEEESYDLMLGPRPQLLLHKDESPLPIDPALHLSDYHEDKSDHIIFNSDQHDHSPLTPKSEDQPMTPKRKDRAKEEHSAGQWRQTTGRKSENQLLQRRRPKEKGLRKLSHRAFEIVLEMRSATYKEVAGQLVDECKEDEGDKPVYDEAQSRQEQNIKRRVYDALNVLIALGVLKKEGRKIERGQHRTEPTEKAYRKGRNELEILRRQVDIRRKNIQHKRHKIKEENAKREAVAAIFARNRDAQPQQRELIFFPFIGVKHVQNEQIDLSNQSLQVRAQRIEHLFGDIDTLRWIASLNSERSLAKKQEGIFKKSSRGDLEMVKYEDEA